MVRLISGQNSLSDQLRSELAQSAAQRFLQRSQPQAPIPEVDYIGPAIPAVAGALQSGLGAYGEYRQNQDKQQQQVQQAQMLAQQLGIEPQQALQILQADPALQKQMIAGIQREREGAVGFERQKELERMKMEGKFDLERAKHEFKLAQTDYKQLNAEEPFKKNYEQALDAGKSIMALASKTPYDPTGYFESYNYKRQDEERISRDITKYVAAVAPILGLQEADRKRMHDSMLEQYYKNPTDRQDVVDTIMKTAAPSNTQEIVNGLKEVRIQSEMQQQPQSQQVLQQSPESQGGVGEALGHKAAVLGAAGATNLGRLGDLQKMQSYPVGGSGQGLPADYLANLENMDPELIKQIEAQRAQESPEQKASPLENPFQLPTSADVKGAIANVLPEGFLENRDLIDSGLEAVGQDLPIYALAGMAGGANAIWQPMARSMLSGASVDAVAQLGGGPFAQFLASLGAGMAVDKGFRTAAEGTLRSRGVSDLAKSTEQAYDQAALKGANTQLPTKPFQKEFDKSWNMATIGGKLDPQEKSAVKALLDDILHVPTKDKIALPELVEVQKTLNSRIPKLPTEDARKAVYQLNKSINKMLELAPTAPGVAEYNLGKNLYIASEGMNRIERGLYDIVRKPSIRNGGSIAGTYIAGLLGLKKSALVVGGLAGTAIAASAARTVQNLYNLPQARELALKATKELVAGNTAKGQRNLLNLAKFAQAQYKKDKD